MAIMSSHLSPAFCRSAPVKARPILPWWALPRPDRCAAHSSITSRASAPAPYSPFLHYNSWFDIAYGGAYNETDAIDRIHAFGRELVDQRHVEMNSFLFDDGWDNPSSMWGFNSGFPDGFTKTAAAAEQIHAGVGVWFSPWGGYDQRRQERIAYGRAHGYEIIKDGYALSGPKYYRRFEQAFIEMVDRYHVNQFKIDGTGNADRVFPGSAFDSDFDAAIHLIQVIRQHKPAIFINLTTGTYPSPYWLFYADSIWRGGDDDGFAGVGSSRQQWITYRDEQTYRNTVHGGPLFPINSLMLHGLIYAKLADRLSSDPGTRFLRRGPLLLRHRHAAAGDVHHAVAAHLRRLGHSGACCQVGTAQRGHPRR